MQNIVSFSFGRTSAYLCKLIKEIDSHAKFIYMDTFLPFGVIANSASFPSLTNLLKLIFKTLLCYLTLFDKT